MTSWVTDGHTVSLEVYEDGISPYIACPGPERCRSRTRCERCYGEGEFTNGPFEDGGERYRKVVCEHCGGSGCEPKACHITDWADATTALECHVGSARLDGVSFPAEIRWRYGDDDGPEWRYADVTYADEI